ncbi:hypothetical protein [Nostoc sp.]|uniref:hypothetical protein n=1 Tax=Nostoc sp. TaxID=1180 RepID=UPI002FF9F9B9
MTFINLDVGWVEERNPTPKDLRKVGFHFVQPNLHLFFFPQSDRRGLITIGREKSKTLISHDF